MTKTEVNIELNVHEIGVLLSALNLLDGSDEFKIERSCGSARAIKDRLASVYNTLDTTSLNLKNESYCEPSF